MKGGSKERRLLPLLYMIDDVEKWNDLEELKKQIRIWAFPFRRTSSKRKSPSPK